MVATPVLPQGQVRIRPFSRVDLLERFGDRLPAAQ
jgi:hypothetical protein